MNPAHFMNREKWLKKMGDKAIQRSPRSIGLVLTFGRECQCWGMRICALSCQINTEMERKRSKPSGALFRKKRKEEEKQAKDKGMQYPVYDNSIKG